MPTSRSDLADFSYFLAIAKHRSFRRAGLQVGVSASALSHALKGLEARLGVRLLNRTNRSVTLTAAGEALFAAVEAPFEAIGSAAEALNRYRGEPVGRIRLNVLQHASALLLAPVLPIFVDRYPGIEIALDDADRRYAGRDFLAQLPLEMTFKDYGGDEKIADLPRPFTRRDVPEGVTPHVGDVAFYAPWGNLALFYRDGHHSPGLIPLGRIEEGIDGLAGRGPIEVSIRPIASVKSN